MPNPNVHDTPILPSDFVKEPEILKFFMEDIDSLLEVYEPGKPENKPDVTKELKKIKEEREIMIKQEIAKRTEYEETINKINMMNPQVLQSKINDQTYVIQQLSLENSELKDKVKYLEEKLKGLINEKIQERVKEKMKESVKDKDVIIEKQIVFSNSQPVINHI
jgi:predicted nuclease with TOPRIM domain